MAGTDATPTQTTRCAQVYEIHKVKAFTAAQRTRLKLFRTDQLWCEIACYEPGQSTVMHKHPFEEEAITVIEGTANMNIDGEEVVLPQGSVVRFDKNVMHDVRNLQDTRCVIMFTKIPTRLARSMETSDG